MRYEIGIALLTTALLGAGWLLRRHFPAPATGRFIPRPVPMPPIGAIRRRPF
jgi:hypothetical protein